MHRRADAPTPTTSGTESPSAARVRRFRARVLEWGADHRRDLPWRRTRDPWRVLVSEVMLQQTQVDRVIAYYCGVSRGLSLAPSTAPGPGPVTWCGSGRVWGTTAGLSTCTGRRRPSQASTAAPFPPTSPPCAPCPASAPTPPGPCSPSPSRPMWRPSTPTWSACCLGAWREPGLTLRQAQSLADRLLPAGRFLGVQPVHVRPRGHGLHGGHSGVRPLSPAPPVPVEAWRPVRTRPVAGQPLDARPRRRSPDRIARVAGASSRPCARAPCRRRCWPPPAGGPTTRPGPSGSRYRSWPRGSPSGPTVTRRCSGCDERAGLRFPRVGSQELRNSTMWRFTTSGCSTCMKWPASSMTTTCDPSAMKSSGLPMELSNMHPSSRPCR